MAKHFILRLESYEGDDTFIRCGSDDQDFMFCIAHVDVDGLELVDNGYRTIAEAQEAWPEAIAPKVWLARGDSQYG